MADTPPPSGNPPPPRPAGNARRAPPSMEAPAQHKGELPWVRLRSASPTPNIFRKMVDAVDRKARAGDLVFVYDKIGAPYGVAIYNPKSLITLRLISRDMEGFTAAGYFGKQLERAAALRRGTLRLDEVTDAYRLVHDQGDGLPGLTIDRYGDWFVLDFYSLGMFKQAAAIERELARIYPGARFVRRASEYTERMEGFKVDRGLGGRARIRENGVQFEVDLGGGKKTGFFCDQRDNRMALASMCKGKKVLDVCAYTGGFGIYAKKLGGAEEVTCVELDPESSAACTKNANINNVRINAVCADAFPYMRQMHANQQKYGVVILDPYKLISSREDYGEGRKKYVDINRLGMSILEEGGILVTCSCSGMFPWEDFQQVLRTAAGTVGRRVQIFRKSGAGGDHPFAADYPEGEYLKVLWCRVL